MKKEVMKLAWKIYNDTGTRTFKESLIQTWECLKK